MSDGCEPDVQIRFKSESAPVMDAGATPSVDLPYRELFLALVEQGLGGLSAAMAGTAYVPPARASG